MKGVTRIEGLRLAPDFPFRLLPASESPIWRQRLARRGSAVATEHGPPLADFGRLWELGFWLQERALCALARVDEPGSAPGSCFSLSSS